MFSRDNPASADSQHPADDVLVRFLDGLLAPAEARTVQAHLDLCWECRRHCGKFQDAIAAYFDFQECAYSEDLQPPPNNWIGFEARLNQLERQLQSVTLREPLPQRLWRLVSDFQLNVRSLALRRGAVAASLLTAAVIVATLLIPAPQPVSAMALLRNASIDERAEIEQSGKVLHRVINMEQHAGATGNLVARRRIEIWQAGHKKVVHRVYGANDKLVAGEWINSNGSHVVYQNAKLRSVSSTTQLNLSDDAIWRFAPSAETFAKVTGHLEKISVEEKPGVYVLHYQNGNDKLQRASLTLRRSDLHAIEQTLQVERDGESQVYRFVEAGFEQKPVDDVAAAVFNVDPALLGLPALTEAANPEPLFAPSPAELEVNLLERLDQVNALVRNQVTVSRTATGTLLVEGVVETEERKQEVVGALTSLASIPAVHVAIHTAAEAEEQQLRAPSTRLQVEEVEVTAEAQNGNPDIRRYLAQTRQLSGKQLEDEVHRFSYNVYDHLAEAQLEVLALRQVVQSLSVAEFNSMTPKSRRQWQTLVRKHAERTQSEISAVRDSLAPIFHPTSVKSGLTVPTDLRDEVIMISNLAAVADNGIWQALASSSEESSARLRSPQVWESLDKIEELTGIILKEVQP